MSQNKSLLISEGGKIVRILLLSQVTNANKKHWQEKFVSFF